jgi:ribosomal protein L7/L12
MDREITFRKIAAGHYVNDETGVKITKTPARRIGRNGHRIAGWAVTAPSYRAGDGVYQDDPAELAFATTKADATIPATRIALATRERIADAYADAVGGYIDRVAVAYDDSDRLESPLNEGGPGTGADLIRAARRAWAAEDYDRAVAFIQEAARGYAALRQGQVEAAHHDALAADEKRAAEARYFAQQLPFAHRIREHREATGCGLREAKSYAVAEARANAEIEYACRARLAQMAAFDEAAYLSVEFTVARQTRSSQAAMAAGRRSVVDRAHADALTQEDALNGLPPAIRLGRLARYATLADEVRQQYRDGLIGDDGAALQLMDGLGVTYDGAVELLDAESTAALA